MLTTKSDIRMRRLEDQEVNDGRERPESRDRDSKKTERLYLYLSGRMAHDGVRCGVIK